MDELARNRPLNDLKLSFKSSLDQLPPHLFSHFRSEFFINRFLLCAAKRSRLMPDGEGVPEEALSPIADRLRGVVEWARQPRILRRDPEATAVWHSV